MDAIEESVSTLALSLLLALSHTQAAVTTATGAGAPRGKTTTNQPTRAGAGVGFGSRHALTVSTAVETGPLAATDQGGPEDGEHRPSRGELGRQLQQRRTLVTRCECLSHWHRWASRGAQLRMALDIHCRRACLLRLRCVCACAHVWCLCMVCCVRAPVCADRAHLLTPMGCRHAYAIWRCQTHARTELTRRRGWEGGGGGTESAEGEGRQKQQPRNEDEGDWAPGGIGVLGAEGKGDVSLELALGCGSLHSYADTRPAGHAVQVGGNEQLRSEAGVACNRSNGSQTCDASCRMRVPFGSPSEGHMDVIDGKEPVTEPATQSSLAASDAVRIGELTERGGLTIELAMGILLDQDLSDPSLLV